MTSKEARHLYGSGEALAVDRGTPEWDRAWGLLSEHIRSEGLGDGSDLAQSNEGECWQHMGSTRDAEGEVHCFRHRHHPMTGRREYAHV